MMKSRACRPCLRQPSARRRPTRPSVTRPNDKALATRPDTKGIMTDAVKTQSRGGLSESDRYLAFLALALLGYALMGKGFAYLGFPPLYIGEIVFLIGVIVFVRTGALVASLATLPSVMLVALMVWVLARTIPFIGVYGFDAL